MLIYEELDQSVFATDVSFTHKETRSSTTLKYCIGVVKAIPVPVDLIHSDSLLRLPNIF